MAVEITQVLFSHFPAAIALSVTKRLNVLPGEVASGVKKSITAPVPPRPLLFFCFVRAGLWNVTQTCEREVQRWFVCVRLSHLSSQQLVGRDAQRPPVHRKRVAGVGALEGLEKFRSWRNIVKQND